MSDNIVYLITGTNKGIGLAMVRSLLQRLNTTVIAVYRQHGNEVSASTLNDLETAPSSNLIHIPIHTSSYITSLPSIPSLLPPSIAHIDVLVANAGGTSGFHSVATTSADDMRSDFETNAIGPAELFRACWPLLQKSSIRKFVLMSSSVGSIGCLSPEEHFPATAYGMSKAAANWWARSLSLEMKGKGLVVGVLHPGWVKTDMGQGIADAAGVKEFPGMTAEDSVEMVLEQMDTLTLEDSGEFITYKGGRLPW